MPLSDAEARRLNELRRFMETEEFRRTASVFSEAISRQQIQQAAAIQTALQPMVERLAYAVETIQGPLRLVAEQQAYVSRVPAASLAAGLRTDTDVVADIVAATAVVPIPEISAT